MKEIGPLADVLVRRVGFFNSHDVTLPLSCTAGHSDLLSARRQHQYGVVRSNCIDSLDRTNTAQFCLGRAVLGHQLHALGVIQADELSFVDHGDQVITKLLAKMYEELGDVIALQYGGSEAHAAMLAKLQGRSNMGSSVSDFRKTVRRAWQ